MFSRLRVPRPQDPSYVENLKGLGFHLNTHGQFLRISDPTGPSRFYQYNPSRSDYIHEVHKDAMSDCVRKIILAQLSDYGLKQLYLTDVDYTRTRPKKPYINILTTDTEELKHKSDVIIIVGESHQDLGIWSYRIVFSEPGIEAGSAVGLMKILRVWGYKQPQRDSVANYERSIEAQVEKMGLHQLPPSPNADQRLKMPGIIVVNPGQLVYSHDLEKNMSEQSWYARPKPSPYEDFYVINETFNRVSGHTTPEEHVKTVFEQVLPGLLKKDVNLFLVAIGDGSESLLKYVDKKLANNCADPIGAKIDGIALMEPTFKPAQITADSLKTFLAAHNCAMSWVISKEPRGQVLQVPRGARPATDAERAAERAALEKGGIDIPGSRERAFVNSSAFTYPAPIVGNPDDPHPHLEVIHALSGDRVANQRYRSDDAAIPELAQEAAEMADRAAMTAAADANIAARAAATSPLPSFDQSSAHVHSDDTNSLPDPDRFPYDYVTVCAPTFSSGVYGNPDKIWPEMMGGVLEWFETKAVATAEKKRAQEKRDDDLAWEASITLDDLHASSMSASTSHSPFEAASDLRLRHNGMGFNKIDPYLINHNANDHKELVHRLREEKEREKQGDEDEVARRKSVDRWVDDQK